VGAVLAGAVDGAPELGKELVAGDGVEEVDAVDDPVDDPVDDSVGEAPGSSRSRSQAVISVNAVAVTITTRLARLAPFNTFPFSPMRP
jgi:hypothetical protein